MSEEFSFKGEHDDNDASKVARGLDNARRAAMELYQWHQRYPLLGLTIGDMFDETATKYPDSPALISRHQHIRLSYRELQTQVNQCAKGFMQLGMQKGQRVGIWSPNRAVVFSSSLT